MYGSTWDILDNLYDKLSIGGYIVVDDFALPGCRAALNDFRMKNDIHEPMEPIDWTGVFWKKGNYRQISSKNQIVEATYFALRFIYEKRKDLQVAFPDVKKGDYTALINWVRNVLAKNFIDPYYGYLLVFEEGLSDLTLFNQIKDLELEYK